MRVPTNACSAQDLDMLSVTEPELEFSTDVELAVDADRTLDAFVVHIHTPTPPPSLLSPVLRAAHRTRAGPLPPGVVRYDV